MYMKTKIFILFTFFHLTIFAQESKMSNVEIENFKKDIIADSKKIQTLTADFTQYKVMSFLDKPIVSKGKLYLQNPKAMRWNYTQPIDYNVIFNNGKIYINDEGKKSSVDLQGNKKFEKLNQLIVGSVSGNLFDTNDFVITYVKTDKSRIAKLQPKIKDVKKYIKEIQLTFYSGQSTVTEVKLIEPSDDYTKILFTNKSLNKTINASVFNP
ncbi:outer membrane lipoprotein carrier protein LolA [Empedobacter falsenii]|uniref:Outer membrane lipoprotein carrier protein LolA n=2 Tax=Empedobacter falsenii TaxID=343874 RepID=A0A427BJT7_9FLAO|nr:MULTISPECIES: outer membrane lipoprotein carrier protein LolA [Empedobacter]MDH0659741.1 outer membrane lipoprotein carrier protein LolA [Empedobacter sp. GD03865]MDH1881727.1 outer membrane lipoprotein carrier protein LolA [Empedobacter sp. GD03797]MDM1041415.1 outer membrane lipoprotein carrier protein LolA [Empedobacter brevis]MDM1134994.1 outer membrane lipoprotein carrier protein LolA [Empedobacter sp. R750]RRT88602.1 outer membrane lipoprotein carrier protein LolA [Empedobacter falsen